MIGRMLGHYKITELLGKGGMGEVYRANDTKLGRDVAIKVLPANLSDDHESSARFAREARTLANLQHPNVASIYGFEEVGDTRFLVMELVEGDNLAHRLENGALAIQDAVNIASQIARGLEAAHEKSIIHRDLKPANVQVTGDRTVKILDFGLARMTTPDATEHDLSSSPTVTEGMTRTGVVLGTAAYMSPEQARGQKLDRRTDIWSFGCVLFEMLTGNAPFKGRTVTDVIAEIMKSEPSWDELPADTPSHIRTLLWRCLLKDPHERLRDIGEARFYLNAPDSNLPGFTPDQMAPKSRRLVVPILAAVAATVVAMVLGAWLLRGSLFRATGVTATAPQPMVRATIHLPEGHRISGWASPTVAISDDGSTLAFVTVSPEGKKQLYVRPLDATRAVLVPESDTAEGPVFSPDGKWVLFAVAVSGGARNIPPELRMYSLESGLTQTLCPVRDYFGADWREDGTIVWMDQIPRGFWRINAQGGSKENFLTTYTLRGEERALSAGWLTFMPDGNRMLVSLLFGTGFMRGAVLDLETGRCTDLGIDALRLLLLPDGRLAWVDNQGTLMVAPFDAQAERLLAAGRAVDQNISVGGAQCPVLAVSRNGTAILSRGPLQGSGRNVRRVVRLNEDGGRTPLPIEEGVIGSFDVSPDGTRIVVATLHGIRIHNLDRAGVLDLPLGNVIPYSTRVKWSPDGRWIAFPGSEVTSTTLDVYVVAADGTAPPRRLFNADSEAQPAAWDRDGKSLLVADFATDEDTRIRVLRLPLEGGPPQELDLGNIHGTVNLSPQREMIAYIQPQGDTYSVIVRSYPDLGPKVAVASGDYWDALWSRDGKTLYAFDQDGVDAFTLHRSPRLTVESQQRLIADVGDVYRPVVPPVENGFYVLEDVPGAGVVTELEVIVNWVGSLP